MTIISLTTIHLLMFLGLAATVPAVVCGILGIYFHGRTASSPGSNDKMKEDGGPVLKGPNRKRAGERGGKEYMSLTEALDPSVMAMPHKTPGNSRPRKTI